jgi:hypothetical protein
LRSLPSLSGLSSTAIRWEFLNGAGNRTRRGADKRVTRCGPRGSCIVRFPFHHTTSRRDASANSVRVAIVAEQSIRLLRPEDFLTVGQSDPHPPGDRIQVFPGEREDVGQEGFDALVQRRAWPPRDAASSPRRAASAFTVRPPAYRNAFAILGDRPK